MLTHDRYFLDRVCSEIIEIDNRQLYSYKGNYSYYLEKRQERIEATNAEIARANNLYRTELEWMRRMPQARGHKARYREEAFYELEKVAKQRTYDANVKLDVKASYIGSKIFEADHLCKRFGDLKILDDFSYIFARYEKMGIVGNNGTGKSTFINTFAGSARAKAADRPGVTKGKQWVSTEKFDLLDMPGVLWKKFDSKTTASNLAFIGSIKDDILDVEELAMNLLDEVRRNYPDLVAQRYKLDAETLALPPYELMEAIGRKRGLLVRGGEVNTERCAVMLVDEFRACKWGRISLERPPQRDDMADFAEEDEE